MIKVITKSFAKIQIIFLTIIQIQIILMMLKNIFNVNNSMKVM